MLACHNFWHTALFYVEKGDIEGAVSIYDKYCFFEVTQVNTAIFSEIGRRGKSGSMLDVVDAASLLLRLEFEGFEVGEHRWQSLVPLVEPHIDDHVLSFNDAHVSMVLTHADEQLSSKHMDSISRFVG